MKSFIQFIAEQEEQAVRTGVVHLSPYKPDGSLRSNSVVAKKTKAHQDLTSLLGDSDDHTTFTVHAKSDGIPAAIGHDEQGTYVEVGKHGKLRSHEDVDQLRPAILEKDKTGGAFTDQRISGLHEVVKHLITNDHPLTRAVRAKGVGTRLHGELFWNSLAKGETPDEPGHPGTRTYVMTPYSKEKTAGTKGGFAAYSGELNNNFSEDEISQLPKHSTTDVKVTHDLLPNHLRQLTVPANDIRARLAKTPTTDHKAVADLAEEFHRRTRERLHSMGYKDPWSHEHIQPWGEGVVLRKKLDPSRAVKVTSEQHQQGMYDQLLARRVSKARQDNPEIAQQHVHHHVTIGSMGIPTVGHGAMVKEMVGHATTIGNVGKIVVGMTRPGKTSPSPLSAEQRETMLRHTSGNPNITVAHVNGIGGALHPIWDDMFEPQSGHVGAVHHLHIHIGPDDREHAEAIKSQLENNQLFIPGKALASIHIHTAKSREVVGGEKVSGTRTRQAIAAGDEEQTKKLTGMGNHPQWKQLWNAMTTGGVKVKRG